ncbi:MAG TPA: hypothetical protein VFY47_03905 [Thermoleophilaceae bacterium]|nr:hypothetical protein [Thermoleophilaceae bacterium]
MTASTPSPEPERDDGLGVVYWIIGGVVVVLVIIGLITYSGEKKDQEAQDKAQELTQKFEQAGLPVPEDQDIIVRSLGSDGGHVCDNPASALGRAVLLDQFANGGSFVGRRPVIVDRDLIRGQALILETYCPDKLEEFRDKFNDLKFDDTIKE